MAVDPNENEVDTALLRGNPQALVVRYQGMIRIIVRKYVVSGMFDHASFEDIVQSVNTALLRNIARAQVQYNGSTLVKTYISSIIRNICLQLHHAEERQMPTERFDENVFPRPNQIEERLAIAHSIAMFRAVLQLFDHHAKLARLLLCLKLWYRIPLEPGDVLRWNPRCDAADLRDILSAFGARYERMPRKTIFRIFTPFANRAGNKTNSDDAVRKWTHEKIGEILELMNGSAPSASFDEESLGTLVEDYFSPFLLDE